MPETFTHDQARQLKFITFFYNNWRRRYIRLYEHPTDNTKVVSVGYPLKEGINAVDENAKPIIAVENRQPGFSNVNWENKTARNVS